MAVRQRPSAGDHHDPLSTDEGRYVLYDLLEVERTTVDDLALHVAARRHGVRAGVVSEYDWAESVLELVEQHLPRLEAAGLIEFDRDAGTVARGERFETAKPELERARTDDRDDVRVAPRGPASARGDRSTSVVEGR